MNRPHAAPRKLGRYELLRELGRGNMGAVYLGRDAFAGGEVAVKVCPAEPPGGMDPEAHRRLFFNEAHAAGLLAHPNIVRVFDAAFDDDRFYLVMEHVEGGRTLRDHLRADALLAIGDVLQIVFKCALALDHAHRQGVVHRDVKPANVLLTPAGEPKLTDFGIAHTAAGEITDAVKGLATPRYAAPEVIAGERADARADLYSLGVVLFELLAGRPLFDASSVPQLLNSILNEPPPRLRSLRPEVPAAIDGLIGRMLDKSPERRYASAMDVAADLSLFLEEAANVPGGVVDSEKFRLARPLDFFDDFSDTEVWEFVRASRWLRARAGTQVIRAGSADSAFYILASGEAVAEAGGSELNRLTAGDCFGEIAYVTGGPRSADVRILDEACLIQVSHAHLERASAQCRLRFQQALLRNVIRRLVSLSAQVADAALI
jgi:serine/threonine protein kinase